MSEPEPKVLAADVIAVLKRRIIDDDPNRSEVRAAIAADAGCSVETVKRIMAGRWKVLDLDRADRLLVAAGGHISECHIIGDD